MAYDQPRWLQRSIDQLEVPECDCKFPIVQVKLHEPGCNHTDSCNCPTFPFTAPCPHAIDADHDVPWDEWVRMIANSPDSDCDSNAPSLPATDYTDALPGSPAKIDVIQGRIARGEEACSTLDTDPASLERIVRVFQKGSSKKTPRTVLAVETHKGVQICGQ